MQFNGKKTKITGFSLSDYLGNMDFCAETEDLPFKNEGFQENNSGKPQLQENSMDFDINSDFSDNFAVNHVFIVKALKISVFPGFALKIIEISFYWKNPENAIFQCKERENTIKVAFLRKNDSILVRLQRKNGVFAVIVNKNQEIEAFIGEKQGNLRKIEGGLAKNVKKCIDSRWIHQFLLILTEELKVLAFNTQGESVFFLEKSGFFSNSFTVSAGKQAKSLIKSEKNAFLLKNEEEVKNPILIPATFYATFCATFYATF